MSIEQRFVDHLIATYATDGTNELEAFANNELRDYADGPIELKHEPGQVADPEYQFSWETAVLDHVLMRPLDTEMQAHQAHPDFEVDNEGIPTQMPDGISPTGEFIFDTSLKLGDFIPWEAQTFYDEAERVRRYLKALGSLGSNNDTIIPMLPIKQIPEPLIHNKEKFIIIEKINPLHTKIVEKNYNLRNL